MRTTPSPFLCVALSSSLFHAQTSSGIQEIKFGDNDTLSAITASMIHADYLFLLTDVDALYTANPRKDPSAKPLEVVASVDAIRSQGIIL